MNQLTEKLLSEGWTYDNHPDYVKPVHSLYFEYTHAHTISTVRQTACGLYWKPDDSGELSYDGVNYSYENDNFAVNCPYSIKFRSCPHCVLKLTYTGLCPTSLVSSDQYDYSSSIEKVRDEIRALESTHYNEFIEKHPEAHCCACRFIDSEDHKTKLNYDPDQCIDHGRNGCWQEICACTGKRRNTERGNIYYDEYITRKMSQGFLHWEVKSVVKGNKFFESQKSISCLEEWLRVNPKGIDEKVRMENHYSLFMDERLFIEVRNIRIEKRVSKDLIQDLMDARDGIHVSHSSVINKKATLEKRKKREIRAEAKQRKSVRVHSAEIREKLANGVDSKGNPLCSRVREDYIEFLKKHAEFIPEQLSLFSK